MRTLTVTVCQLDNRAQHRPEALRALRRHVVERGSELLVLPELPFSDWLAADPVPDPARWQHSVEAHRAAVDRLQELGVRAVVASRPTVEVTGSRRNQAFIWTREGGAVRVRDKRYIPDEPGYWEASWYDRGDPEFPTVLVADARIGILVCTDLWFFEWARHYARSGVDLLCLPRATPYDSLGRWLAGGQVAATCSGAYTSPPTSGILPALGSTAVASGGWSTPMAPSWPQPQPRSRSPLSRLISISLGRPRAPTPATSASSLSDGVFGLVAPDRSTLGNRNGRRVDDRRLSVAVGRSRTGTVDACATRGSATRCIPPTMTQLLDAAGTRKANKRTLSPSCQVF